MGSPAEDIALERHAQTAEPLSAGADEPALDLVHLSRQTLGDPALETELLAMFDKQAQQLALRLSEPLGAQEAKQRAELAHMLKGSARSIGAFGVSRAAEAYELTLRNGRGDAAAALRRLVGAIGVARAAIAELLGPAR